MSISASVLTQLREHMHDETINLFFEDSKEITPIMAHAEMRSMEQGYGRKFIVPFEYDVGFNASFGDTLPTAVGVSRGRWEIDPVIVNVTANWQRDEIDAAKGDAEKFDVISSETDAKTQLLRNLIAQQLTGRGWGSLGAITAVNASPAYVDVSPSVVNRVALNMTLVAAADEATSALHSATARTVTGFDPDLGRIYLSGSPTALSWAAGSHLFITGSRENAAPPTSRLVLTGLKGWLDPEAPGSVDASPSVLHGVTRANIPAVSGYRIDASSLDHEQAIIRGANRLKKFAGVRADTCFVSNEDWEILAADKSAIKNLVVTNAGKYQISFPGIELLTDGGNMKVLADAFVPQGTAWMGPFENKKLSPFIGYSGDNLVNIDNKDGQDFRRKTDGTTGYEMVLYSRLQYICPAPGKFAVVSGLPST